MPVEEGGFDIAACVKRKTVVAFEWRAKGIGFEEVCETRVRCDNATGRSIPMPEAWSTALKCLDLTHIVKERLRTVREEHGFSDMGCVMLGQPKPSPLPSPGAALLPGAAVRQGSSRVPSVRPRSRGYMALSSRKLCR